MLHKQLLIVSGLLVFSISLGICQEGENQSNAKPNSKTSKSGEFFKMGDFRLINNNWGSKEMGCKDNSYEIFINNDKSFGWNFQRGACGDSGTKPDYPEVEFGMHPFSVGSKLATTPDYSSTKVLPLQIKNIKSASIRVDGMTMNLQKEESFNLNFEMWFCEQHPATGNHKNAYAELITFWAWQNDRWECVDKDIVRAGDGNYRLCHQSDNWGGWRYFQFRLEGGPNKNYTGKLDIKAMLDWLVKNRKFSNNLWISRFEIGSEIGDNTKGTVTMRNITIEVNGVSKSPEFYEPVTVTAPNNSKIHANWNTATISAHATIRAVNLKGKQFTLYTGATPATITAIGSTLPTGVYIMSLIKDDIINGIPIVVPVLR